jgi:hypothetical protein
MGIWRPNLGDTLTFQNTGVNTYGHVGGTGDRLYFRRWDKMGIPATLAPTITNPESHALDITSYIGEPQSKDLLIATFSPAAIDGERFFLQFNVVTDAAVTVSARIYDGEYDYTSTTDFPLTGILPTKGVGLVQELTVKPITPHSKTFDYTAITITEQSIRIPLHGFGEKNTTVSLFYAEGTGPITGLTNRTNHTFFIYDENLLVLSGGNVIYIGMGTSNVTQIISAGSISNRGTGTGHRLYDYSHKFSYGEGSTLTPMAIDEVIDMTTATQATVTLIIEV